MNGQCDIKKKQYSVDTATDFIYTNTVTPYLTNISNKELIIKTRYIFEYFPRTTQDTDLVAAMENLSDVWYLN